MKEESELRGEREKFMKKEKINEDEGRGIKPVMRKVCKKS